MSKTRVPILWNVPAQPLPNKGEKRFKKKLHRCKMMLAHTKKQKLQPYLDKTVAPTFRFKRGYNAAHVLVVLRKRIYRLD